MSLKRRLNKTTVILCVIFHILMLISCTNSVTVSFEITNNTGKDIDSLFIEPTITNEKEKYISIKPSGKVIYISDMSGIAKVDGGYTLSYLTNNQKKIKRFGYYTNGYPLENDTKIIIENDTILIK